MLEGVAGSGGRQQKAVPVSIGSQLRVARLEAGLTVEQVSARTRIRAQLVRDLEADDPSGCGGAVYARGHLRAIAAVVGLDPVPLVADFDATHDGVPEAPAAAAVHPGSSAVGAAVLFGQRPGQEIRDRGRPPWAAAGIAATVVVIAGIVIAQVTSGGGGAKPTAASRPPAPTSTGPAAAVPPPAASSTTLPSTAPPAAAPTTKGVVVVISARDGASWVGQYSSTAAGAAAAFTNDGLILAGQQKQFTAKRMIKLRIGDPSKIEVTVNGRDLGRPSTTATPIDLQYGPGDPRA